MSQAVMEAPAAEKPPTTPPNTIAHAPHEPVTAKPPEARAPIIAREVTIPTPDAQPEANKPVLLTYQDATGKNHVLVTGDGHGTWRLPHWNQVEGLPKEGVTITQEEKLTLANLGTCSEKPALIIKDHALFTWMPVDLAKMIVGDQLRAIDAGIIAPAPVTPPKVTIPPAPPIDPAALATTDHAGKCAGCAQCKPTPKHEVSDIAHQGVQPATQSMLAMHGKTTAQIGAAL
jgi:hypothetical protein